MHIIDPDKLATIWGIPWETPKEFDEVIDENYFIFSLPGNRFFFVKPR
jgi:hypothetical protein